MTSWFWSAFLGSRRLMFLYLALMASICGLRACIFFIDFMLESLNGKRMELMTMVTTTMDQPKLWTKAPLNQLTMRAKRLVGPSETAAPQNGAGFSSNVVRAVSLKVASCMAALPSGRKTAAKNVSAAAPNDNYR